ncbi:baseplate multidomain protein megatron [Sedimentitalea todarodis]|uniref:Glycoside hydrolase/phage tail family protein n=1 Tax=Sedimentitalea todarodis TaxID=1631240 RepID=A0ABU3VCI3_9RHOB|nr:glycoside hydrolase/phage tail family protein [Sedimentitalea todarodis]MDU9003885.1 glycoside hydrolase/phage tail family protein [Sedimentitalea todarodis]
MATILLSAVGAAIGGTVGGTVAGLSSVAIGRAVGATLGQVIDQRLLGQGSESVETGRVDRFRLTQSGDGNPIAQVFGRVRVGGQVIWASDFLERSATTGGGGKGSSRSTPEVTTFSYSVSLAIAVCEGEIASIGRVWADGEEVAPRDLNMRVYTGTADQLPDPLIEAIEGAGLVPAYRGTAYVVLERLPLGQFGNRIPQFSFEVLRAEQSDSSSHDTDLAQLVKGAALIPGTGEYALATTPVHYTMGPGINWAANSNSRSGQTDFMTSFEALTEELPSCRSVSLVASWFGSDLRCGHCALKPKIERAAIEGGNMAWSVAGQTRAMAEEIELRDGRPIYGGTPADRSVIEAIRHMNASGRRVMFYPFILMEQTEGNGLEDPWTSATDQPALPWRGRITLSVAPGRNGSPDGTAFADQEVAVFFGSARATDFRIDGNSVAYDGPQEWGLRRFVLHYAALCAAAGGVHAFCIGSEMRALTQIRGASGFAAVAELRALAAEVRALLGPNTRIGYAADWSEYFGYQPQDGTGDRYFHLDPLWADDNIDFIGIDNYMPLSDWRDGDDHADAGWQSIYNPDYLAANIEGGEGYEWYYHSPEAEAAQFRTPIEDPDHGEPWVWRHKDIRNWWQNAHHERISGVRQDEPTSWAPESKPIWFTELGCAAIDKGTNQPNKFLDQRSSESALPKYSDGSRDDFMQVQYLRTVLDYWAQPANNPVSEAYGAPMIDLENAYVWAWDTRPYPTFPNNVALWSDGKIQARGHWLNGRAGARTLASVVEEICRRSGVTDIDTSGLFGMVRGYSVDDVATARTALQPLMLRYGFDAIERDGVLRFVMRGTVRPHTLAADRLAVSNELDGQIEHRREAEAEMTGRVRLRFVQSGADHDIVAEEAVLADTATHAVTSSDLQIAMTRSEGRQVAERWLAEARVSRESVRFALPPSLMHVGAGDVVQLASGSDEENALYRVDRVEQSDLQLLDSVRIERDIYETPEMADDVPSVKSFAAPVPVLPLFMDLPLMRGDEVAHAPHLAVTATPWPGSVALYSSSSDDSYALSQVIASRSVVGQTETPLVWSRSGIWDDGAPLQIRLLSGALEAREKSAILSGANLAAIGDGTNGNWELFQFQNAELVAEDTYRLTRRLRGQGGSDGLMPAAWPAGSWFVLMDGTPGQIDLASAQKRIARHYRIGPARRGYDDPSYMHLVEAFDGNGLRPYAPCHLGVRTSANGDLQFEWVRRTRIDGDSWDLPEVPLGEENESYVVRIWSGASLLREVTVASPGWTYSQEMQDIDAVTEPLRFEVAQVSDRYGFGLFSSLDLAA